MTPTITLGPWALSLQCFLTSTGRRYGKARVRAYFLWKFVHILGIPPFRSVWLRVYGPGFRVHGLRFFDLGLFLELFGYLALGMLSRRDFRAERREPKLLLTSLAWTRAYSSLVSGKKCC